MIVGIGIDIAETNKFEKDCASEAFLHKVFTPTEIIDCTAVKNSAERFAGKFALKEAFMKAIGAGIRQEVWFTDIEILNKDTGKPYITLVNKAEQRLLELGVKQIHASISHSSGVAAGVVIIEK